MLIVHFRKLTKFGFKFGCRLRLQLQLKKWKWPHGRLVWAYCASAFWVSRLHFLFHFFLARMNSDGTIHAHGFIVQETKCTVHSSYNHIIHKKKHIKMGVTALFTHLKIILQQCFQLSVFNKLSCIQTDLTYFENLTIDYKFFLFSPLMSNFVIIGYYLQ